MKGKHVNDQQIQQLKEAPEKIEAAAERLNVALGNFAESVRKLNVAFCERGYVRGKGSK